MTNASALQTLIEPTLTGMGYELVRVLLIPGGRATLQIMAEPADGREMTLEDCEKISRQLSALLDVEDPIASAYQLEVSSPGIDRPLTRPKDFINWAGHLARLELAQPVSNGTGTQRRFKGHILGLAEDQVRLRMENDEEVQLPLSNISKAQLLLTEALIRATQKKTHPASGRDVHGASGITHPASGRDVHGASGTKVY